MRTMLARHAVEAAEWSRPWDDGEGERRVRRDPDAWRFEPLRTQQEVAEMLGVSRGTVFKDEQVALRKIAEAVVVSLDH